MLTRVRGCLARRATGRSLAAAALLAWALGAAPATAIEGFAFLTPGAGDGLREVLRAASLLVQANREGVEDAQEIVAAARADYARLVAALYGEGHYSGVVRITLDGREAAEIPPLAAPARIAAVTVTVEPGPPFAFALAAIAPLAPGTVLPATFAPGARARSGAMQEAVEAAVEGWRSAGHAKARPAGEDIVADHRRAEIAARFLVAPGPKVRFGALAISGADRMRPARVRAIAGLPEGAVFDPAVLAKAAARLRRTGVFRSVALAEAETLGPGARMDITASLVEEQPRRFGLGAELASFEGLKLSGYWLHRNLLGGAERLRIEGDIGGIGAQEGGLSYRLAARLTRPATLTPDTELALGAVAERVEYRDYTASRGGVEAGLVHRFSDRLSVEGGLALRIEHVTNGLGPETYGIVSAPLGVVWDRRDRPLDAQEGFYLEARATPFLGLTGDADSGARLTLDARAYWGPGTGRLVLAGRLQAGAVLGAGLLGTPRAMLFYSGGGGSVRGQPFQSLGVEVGCGPGCTTRIGGRSFLGLSAEARLKLTGTIGLVAFGDAGMVAAGVFDGGEWHAGAGLGLRYDTGIGPIRLDVAAPLSGRTGEGVQLYVGIGQAF